MLGSKYLSSRGTLGNKYISIGSMGHKMSTLPYPSSSQSVGRIEPNPEIHNNFNSSLVSRQPIKQFIR